MSDLSEMQTFASRSATFERAHQIAKRRASSQRKAKHNVEWPHNFLSGVDLARAGFFYRPSQDSPDNVQCFLCGVKLDGWEPSDDPLAEHISHSSTCAWATALSVSQGLDDSSVPDESRDPMGDELREARKATFTAGTIRGAGIDWPHETKKGWKCKVDKMVAAGWCFDPSPEADDGVTCFYCNLSLDGWEPKDDPYQEHQRRSPECAFLGLIQRYSDEVDAKKKTKSKGRARTSAASRGSRISNASSMTGASEAVSTILAHDDNPEVDHEDEPASGDDSVMTTDTSASRSTGKSTRRGSKSKRKINHARSRNISQQAVDSSMTTGVNWSSEDIHPSTDATLADVAETGNAGSPAPETGRQGRKGGQSALKKKPVAGAEPPTKRTRGRKAKAAQPAPQDVLSEDEDIDASVSAQLQDELEQSVLRHAEPTDINQEATVYLQEHTAKIKQGVKRTSDGAVKHQGQAVESSFMTLEFPVPPQSKSQSTGNRFGQKDKTGSIQGDNSMIVSLRIDDDEIGFQNPPGQHEETDSRQVGPGKIDGKDGKKNSKNTQKVSHAEADLESPSRSISPSSTSLSGTRATAKGKGKTKKASVSKKRTKGKKTTSTRSSRATVTTDSQSDGDAEIENLERDEREIEAELERIAAEQAAAAIAGKSRTVEEDILIAEPERGGEWEPTPSHRKSKHGIMADTQASSPWQDAETSTPRMQRSLPASKAPRALKSATPSPTGSDKENQPSSLLSAKAPVNEKIDLSPAKQLRPPLAPGTPNARPSPSKTRFALSPSKKLGRLTSAIPWEPIDLDSVLLGSNEPSPGKVGQALASVAGRLDEHEGQMTVEEWINWRAREGERELRRRCEEYVAVFEREGMRALQALGGIEVTH